jgi:hypothetical protein
MIKNDGGNKIYLISYESWRSRSQKQLKGAAFGIGIFDESHTVKSRKTLGFQSLIAMDCLFRIQMTGTPMHHTVRDWVVQAEWLHVKTRNPELLSEHGYSCMEEICNDVKKEGDFGEEAYQDMKHCVFPWTIRRWGETRLANGQPLLKIPELLMRNINLEYTSAEAELLRAWVKAEKEANQDRFISALHSWRLASFNLNLPGTERVQVNGKSVHRTEWEANDFAGGPIFRWLEKTFIPLLNADVGPVPNKAVLFAPLPAQVYLLDWVGILDFVLQFMLTGF